MSMARDALEIAEGNGRVEVDEWEACAQCAREIVVGIHSHSAGACRCSSAPFFGALHIAKPMQFNCFDKNTGNCAVCCANRIAWCVYRRPRAKFVGCLAVSGNPYGMQTNIGYTE